MTVGSPPSRTVTTEFVVPRSIPTARAMFVAPSAPPGLDDTAVDESAALKFARPGPDLQIEGQELESMWLNYEAGGCIPEVLTRRFRAGGRGLGARAAR